MKNFNKILIVMSAFLVSSVGMASTQTSSLDYNATRIAQVLVKNAAEISSQLDAQGLTGAQVQSAALNFTNDTTQIFDYEFSLAFPLKQGEDPACRIENGTLSIVNTWNMQTDARTTVVTVKKNPSGCAGPL